MSQYGVSTTILHKKIPQPLPRRRHAHARRSVDTRVFTIAGAVFGGLVGRTAGGVAGARLGSQLDDQVLDNLECRACGHTFHHAVV